jgi:hypothetical protein
LSRRRRGFLVAFIPCLGWPPAVLADVDVQDLFPHQPSDNLHQMAIILAAAMAVTVPLLVWAAFFRKRGRRHHHRHHQRGTAPTPAEAASCDAEASAGEDDASTRGRRRKKWRRRRRRDHRPLNPTLAQTGGLPPVRTEPPSEPPN